MPTWNPSGSMKPFEQIIVEHGPTVLRVCRGMLSPVDADDAWSETFLSALKAYPALAADANVEAWLVTIARRKAIDVKRAEARRPITLDPTSNLWTRGGRTDDLGPLDFWTAELWAAELWAALKNLPPRQRTAVAYHHLVGLPFKEIADLTGSNTDAARRASADGIAALRKALSRAAVTPDDTEPGVTQQDVTQQDETKQGDIR